MPNTSHDDFISLRLSDYSLAMYKIGMQDQVWSTEYLLIGFTPLLLNPVNIPATGDR